MTSAIAPVSFDANKFISKQSNTPSAAEAGNSFNQILAKQVEAKRLNRSEQTSQRNGDKVATEKQSDKPNVVTKTENATEVAGSTKDKDETVEETLSNPPPPIIALVEDINKPSRANDKGSAKELDANSLVNTDETAATADAHLAGTLAINANSLRELAVKDSGTDSGNRSSSPSVSPDVAALGVNELAKANAINESISKSQANTTSTELNDGANGSFLTALAKANQNSITTAHSTLEADAKTDAHTEAFGSAAELNEKGLLDNVQLKLGSASESKDVAQAANSVANNEITPSNFQTIAQQVVAHASQEQIQQSEHLAPNVGTRAWDQALGQKVIWLVAGGQQSAELTLNPPDLGPLQVVLKVSDDRLTADFSANRAEVREALESALPKLRQILNDAGIQLSGFSVNSQASQQQNQFTQDQSPHSLRRAANSETDTSASSVSNVTQPKFITKVGLVDTFA